MPTSTTWVYAPPGYDPNGSTRYPVVHLIHGTPGTSADWMSGGDIAHVMDVLIAHHLVRPMIVVAPELYGAIIALEAYDNPGSGGRAMLATSAEITAHSPGKDLPTMTFVHPVTVFIAAGAAARGGDASEAAGLAAQLTARGQFHTWTMARTAIPYGLTAVSAALAP